MHKGLRILVQGLSSPTVQAVTSYLFQPANELLESPSILPQWNA